MSQQPAIEPAASSPPVLEPLDVSASAGFAAAAPGAGAPLIPGPATSVAPAVPADRFNTLFGVGAVVMLVLTVIAVVVLAVFVFALLKPR